MSRHSLVERIRTRNAIVLPRVGKRALTLFALGWWAV